MRASSYGDPTIVVITTLPPRVHTLVTSATAMGPLSQQELTADELLLARAEANGYQRGAHREADEVSGRDKHVAKTKKNQDATLRRYVLWRLSAMRNENAQKGLSPPDEEMARRQYLGQNVTAPDLATVKDFIRFYIATSKPQLDKEEKRPTADSINIAAEWFFAGFTRVTGTDTDKDERSEVYNWVRQTLTREGIVVNKHRPKHNFTDRDLNRVLLTLWTRDDLIFIPERYRVQDVTLVLQRVSGRSWRLIYKVDQRWVKNNRDPENIVFGAAAKDHERLFYNDAGFLLAMAIADNALFGYESLEDVRAQEISPGKDELVLRFKDSALERPILRKCTKTGGVTDDPMPKSSFTAILKSTLTNAGYLCGPSIHAIWRQLGKEVDKRYTAVQRSQHLTQADERVFGQSYVANCSSVDGQAAFRNEKSDHRHIEYFQSMEKFHEEGLPDKLPSHLDDGIYRDPELRELEKEMQTLVQPEGGSIARSRPKQQYANRLKKLKKQALRQYQENWIRERRDWKILTRGKAAAQDKSKTDFVQSLCLLIPERGRLAQ
ncbi:AdoMet-dependent rRNA methyltransferase SPB1 [Fonsecaea monophora]|uniref:AdoMet-dependent rRNA methyltransferase SPB1 n=1 Tax=Fonsecaea monophora TaxID=254056 RepID=A0A177FG69_9EURO|nr:AdoMet-dependent rRNA methyltransferase SPB1 [Fonsecaea monophora]OAG42721.1 AdoMet-dependent rRNA methyltransferase SPB1 [Fonsecaea monophora]